MSQIDKLQILGIRSFDNTRAETIQFHTPLTLIVGYNGSGKTTIIECLKYVTTGDLPPNSKGGAFIHDPKLCGEKEVLAQVKLSFKPTSDARMVVTRSLQLTVKKTTRQQKTLEGQLLMVKGGERTAISSRVAELDTILPQYLGVSKAILDSVVFCHQDESLWPMSEPSSLKKRFDEIFEAQKYTKAIDNIKQLRKKQNEELGKFKIIEQHAKEDKDKADKAEKKSRELSDEIETLREETQAFHQQAKEAADKMQEAWNRSNQYGDVVDRLKTAREHREWYRTELENLSKDLKVRPEADEWLESELAQYEERMNVYQQRSQEQATRYKEIEREIGQTRDRQSSKRVEVGKYEQQEATHAQRIKDREEEIKTSAREHNIRGFDMELDDMQISEYMEKIARLSTGQNLKVERLRRDNEIEVQKIQDVLGTLREQRTALQEGKKNAKDQELANDKRLAGYHTDLDSVTMDEGRLATLEASLEDLKSRLKEAKERLSNSGLEKQIKEANKQLKEYEDEGASLQRELIQGTKQASDLAHLNHLKKESKDRHTSLGTMKGVHGSRISELIGREWTLGSLEADFQRVLEDKKRQVITAERQRDGVNRELEQLEFKLKTARKDVKAKELELEECKKHIEENTQAEPEDYPEVLAGAQSDRDVGHADVDNFKNMRDYFIKCIEIAKSDQRCCRLCTRPFDDTRSVRGFISKLEGQISTSALEKAQMGLRELEEELQRIKSAGTSYDTWIRLSKKELPSIRKEVARLEQERERVVREIEHHDRAVTDLEETKTETETLTKPVATMVKCHGESNNFERQIQDLSAKQKGSGLSRTLEDIQDQIEANGFKLKDLRFKIDKLQTEDRSSRDTISALELGLGGAKNKLSTASHELEKKAAINSQIAEMKRSNKEQREILTKLDRQSQELAPRFAEEQAKLNDHKQRAEAKENELYKEATRLNDTVRSLMRADAEIRSYIEDGGPAKLTKCLRDIQAFDKEIASMGKEMKQVTVEMNKIQKELGNQSENKRVIEDNLKFRKRQRDVKAAEEEIEKLASQNAEADQEHHRRDAERWERAHRLATTEETSKMGIMKAKDDQLLQLLNDWNTDYKDAAAKYKKAHIEVETTKAAVEDLGRYGGALDKAIMKYHGVKMEEINRLIEELWRKTYQGTDVDTILIRSDNETGKGNRSYNYRVCMVKQDAEMDMRGRCSAGQKVLASIIIRLALAECFGVNCGLIALDEPTTNLDRDNIQSLAESLHDLIRERQQQRNFQMIVITHDEEFLRFMRASAFCDTYYRVARNGRQKSVIERQNIAGIL